MIVLTGMFSPSYGYKNCYLLNIHVFSDFCGYTCTKYWLRDVLGWLVFKAGIFLGIKNEPHLPSPPPPPPPTLIIKIVEWGPWGHTPICRASSRSGNLPEQHAAYLYSTCMGRYSQSSFIGENKTLGTN